MGDLVRFPTERVDHYAHRGPGVVVILPVVRIERWEPSCEETFTASRQATSQKT